MVQHFWETEYLVFLLRVRWKDRKPLKFFFVFEQVTLTIIFSINWEVVWSVKCQKTREKCSPKPKVTSSKTNNPKIFSLQSFKRPNKAENIHIWEAGIREFLHFFFKKMTRLASKHYRTHYNVVISSFKGILQLKKCPYIFF